MIALFPNAQSDIAAAIEGKRWEARIEAVDRWLDFCALQVLGRRTEDQQRAKFCTIHWTLCRAFEAMAWSEVDSIVDACEKEWG